MNIWDMFHQPNIPDFGDKYVNELLKIEENLSGQHHLIILTIKYL